MVSEMAKSLELAAKSNDIDTVTGGHASFMEKYAELIHCICEGDGDDVIEFSPVDNADDVLEFAAVNEPDEAVEFAAVNEPDEAVEFEAVNRPDEDDDVLEFTPVDKEGEN